MLSARARAMLVSSVHSPALSPCGPPSRNPVTGLKVPGALNSTAAPRASPTARPIRMPRSRDRMFTVIESPGRRRTTHVYNLSGSMKNRKPRFTLKKRHAIEQLLHDRPARQRPTVQARSRHKTQPARYRLQMRNGALKLRYRFVPTVLIVGPRRFREAYAISEEALYIVLVAGRIILP